MDCESAHRLISALIDGEVSAADRERVERHLTKCRSCRREKEEMEAAVSLLSSALPTLQRGLAREIASTLPAQPRPAPVPMRWMSVAAAILFAVVLTFVLSRSTDDVQAPPIEVATVGYVEVEGDLYLTDRQGKTTQYREGAEVGDGDLLENAGLAVAHLTLDAGADVAIKAGTRVRVENRRWGPMESETVIGLAGDGEVIASLEPQHVPFVVEAGDVQVRALGTIFGVAVRAGKVKVRCYEGKVVVFAATTPQGVPYQEFTVSEGETWAGTRVFVEETVADPPPWAVPVLPEAPPVEVPPLRPPPPPPGDPDPIDVPIKKNG